MLSRLRREARRNLEENDLALESLFASDSEVEEEKVMAGNRTLKISVEASLMLLLFISSSLAVMAARADVHALIEVCDYDCIPNCKERCISEGHRTGQCERKGSPIRNYCCCE